MDATWCFLLGMMAGFIPTFAVLATTVFLHLEHSKRRLSSS